MMNYICFILVKFAVWIFMVKPKRLLIHLTTMSMLHPFIFYVTMDEYMWTATLKLWRFYLNTQVWPNPMYNTSNCLEQGQKYSCCHLLCLTSIIVLVPRVIVLSWQLNIYLLMEHLVSASNVLIWQILL